MEIKTDWQCYAIATSAEPLWQWQRSRTGSGVILAVEIGIHHREVSHALLHEWRAALLLQETEVARDFETLKFWETMA